MRVLGSILVVAAAAVVTPVAHAEDAKPAPQVEAIRGFIGSWTGKGTMMTEGKTLPVSVTYDCTESSGGAGVKCKFVLTGIPGFTYMLDDLWGYSAQDGLVHWYAVTNAGEVHDHRGHLDTNGGLLQADIAVKGKMFSEVITIKRKGKSINMSWTASTGGIVSEKGEITISPKTK